MKVIKRVLRIVLLPFFLLGLISSRTRENSFKIIRKNAVYFVILAAVLLYNPPNILK